MCWHVVSQFVVASLCRRSGFQHCWPEKSTPKKVGRSSTSRKSLSLTRRALYVRKQREAQGFRFQKHYQEAAQEREGQNEQLWRESSRTRDPNNRKESKRKKEKGGVKRNPGSWGFLRSEAENSPELMFSPSDGPTETRQDELE